MTQVDFYVLTAEARGDRFALACRVAEKAYRQGHRVVVMTDDEAQARHVDRLLWTFRQESFVPHALAGGTDDASHPVLISPGVDLANEHEVLINLSTEVPRSFGRFERVAELIDQAPESRAKGRERFRYYRDRGYPLATHEIKR